MQSAELRTRAVDLHDVRVAAGLMLAAAAARPLVPGEPGIPCPLRTLTGIPCPLCGMTTSVTAAVHLDLGAAVVASPAGPLLVLAAVAVLVSRRREVAVPAWLPFAVLPLLWGWQLARSAGGW